MRSSNWTPSLVPRNGDEDIYKVLDDFCSSLEDWQ